MKKINITRRSDRGSGIGWEEKIAHRYDAYGVPASLSERRSVCERAWMLTWWVNFGLKKGLSSVIRSDSVSTVTHG